MAGNRGKPYILRKIAVKYGMTLEELIKKNMKNMKNM